MGRYVRGQWGCARRTVVGTVPRPAISWYICSTASFLVRALNSLYMFVVPERELYPSQMPYLETFSGFCSKISLMLRISPLAFFIFTRRRMKYQNRERAWVSFLVKSFMRYAFGLGSRSVGT